ncbi:glycosyltransferase family 4 protein [Taibaiella soli]|uniref:Glycosyltransferase WbuB n=1 Tax=Taibaiella soli TaxID=1649169 RepID=A0A2W2BYQ4_9BACT|nr:glycosyltransferase family 4 protein [Taibaiella soli]PZF73013.1 glycosyltransferase WbuB [Taibaiella soli]
MSKRITIITSAYPPEKGAAPTRVYNLAQTLLRAGNDVSVITAMPNYPTGKIFPGYQSKWRMQELADGINVYRTWLYPSNARNIFKRAASLCTYTTSAGSFIYSYLKKQKPDIVIINTPPLFSGYISMMLAKRAGCKSILNVSDLWPMSALELGAIKQGTTYNMLEYMERTMYKSAHAIVGQSKEILAHIKQHVPHTRSFLYYNLQSTRNGETITEKAEGKRKIVYAGLLGVAQGVFDICQHVHFAELGVEFHIYGDGFEKEKIEAFIKSNPDRGVYYHQSIPASEMPAMLRQYHATIIPLKTNIRGALPSKVFMAVANELPVFFSGSGEGAGLIHMHQLGWVNDPEDYKKLSANIATFATLPEAQYNTILNACRECAQGMFNKTEQDAAFLQFIENI